MTTSGTNLPLAVLLGASEFPRHGENAASMASPKFRASADRFHSYLTGPEQLGLPASRILNLFDLTATDSTQREEIREFFARHSVPPPLIIFYYVGHGSHSSAGYVLHIRTSGDDRSGLRASDVLAMIPQGWTEVLSCLFVDACFSEKAAQEAAISMVSDSYHRRVVFLCSSSVLRKSYLSDRWGKPLPGNMSPDITPFTEALLAALEGDPDAEILTEEPLSGRDIERAMHAYIDVRNGFNACQDWATFDRAPKPKLAGSGPDFNKPLLVNPHTRSGQDEIPRECKATEWTLRHWQNGNKLQPTVKLLPGWAFFLSTEDQFNYFRKQTCEGWPGLDGVNDLTVYELLGRYELLLLFHADIRGACAVRDFLLKSSDESGAVKHELSKSYGRAESTWEDWRIKNNVTAFCFPKQRARVREDGGKWNLLDRALPRAEFMAPESCRAIKAFISLIPKDDHGAADDSQVLANTFQIAGNYPKIIERIYHHQKSESQQCGDLGGYSFENGGPGFSLGFFHDRRRALLIEILVPCGRFAELNRLSDDLGKAGFLNKFVKSTYIAYGAHAPPMLVG